MRRDDEKKEFRRAEMADWRENLIESDDGIRKLLAGVKRVAVLGIKTEAQADQASFYVPRFLSESGVEIVPVPVDGHPFLTDESPRPGTTIERLSQLVPAFIEGGEVTAGNSCPLNDGAAAVIVTSRSKARDLGVTPLARIVSTGLTALAPEYMGLGPIEASRQALARAGMTIDDIDIIEINEAFAAQCWVRCESWAWIWIGST